MSEHEDWNEQPWWEGVSVEACDLRPGQKAGWVYFIACKETMRCKIGYTGGDVEKRLKALQTGSAGELRLMAKHPGTPETEKALHSRFAQRCVRGEWFEMNAALFGYIAATCWLMGHIYATNGWRAEEWLYAGLRMMHEEGGPLPAELAALIGEAEPA